MEKRHAEEVAELHQALLEETQAREKVLTHGCVALSLAVALSVPVPVPLALAWP